MSSSPISTFSFFKIHEYTNRTSGLSRFLPDGSHAGGDVVLFVRHGLFFSEVSNSFFSLLDHYSDDVGVSVLVDNFFLIFTLLLFAVRQIIEATHFLTLFSLISEIFLSWKTSTVINSFGAQKIIQTLFATKHLMGLSSVTFPLII